jgi:1-acyl-sn-glycerol-3-phosphate acyltransferase
MFKRLAQLWRLFATGLSFILFGIGGLLIPLVIVPVILLFSADEQTRYRRGKALIHHLFRFYITVMKSLGVLTYETHDLDKLKQAQLVLANHPSLIDVVFLIALMPNANCVVKSALLKNPFTRGAVKAAGYIVNDESADDVIDAAKAAFKRGDALIVFPEGTRSVPGRPLKLKRGAANVAVRTQALVTPVLIHCEPVTLTKGQPWYKVPASRPHFTIRVEAPISMARYTEMDKPAVAARTLTRELSEFFNQEIRLRERSA